jgi:hypothetical protein
MLQLRVKLLSLLFALSFLVLPSISYGETYTILLDKAVKTGPGPELSFSSRALRAYWINISGTATVQIEVAARPVDPMVPLVTGISTSTMVDTNSPGTRTRVNVTSCSGCTVSVVLEIP